MFFCQLVTYSVGVDLPSERLISGCLGRPKPEDARGPSRDRVGCSGGDRSRFYPLRLATPVALFRRGLRPQPEELQKATKNITSQGEFVVSGPGFRCNFYPLVSQEVVVMPSSSTVRAESFQENEVGGVTIDEDARESSMGRTGARYFDSRL